MSRFFDRAGNPIDLEQWIMLFENKLYQILRQDTIGEAEVSTVWLGIDHSFGEGPPLIFETMIFGPGGRDEQYRYSTEEEAMENHKKLVQEARLIERIQ